MSRSLVLQRLPAALMSAAGMQDRLMDNGNRSGELMPWMLLVDTAANIIVHGKMEKPPM